MNLKLNNSKFLCYNVNIISSTTYIFIFRTNKFGSILNNSGQYFFINSIQFLILYYFHNCLCCYYTQWSGLSRKSIKCHSSYYFSNCLEKSKSISPVTSCLSISQIILPKCKSLCTKTGYPKLVFKMLTFQQKKLLTFQNFYFISKLHSARTSEFLTFFIAQSLYHNIASYKLLKVTGLLAEYN